MSAEDITSRRRYLALFAASAVLPSGNASECEPGKEAKIVTPAIVGEVKYWHRQPLIPGKPEDFEYPGTRVLMYG